jgi:hypothetical protein
MALAANELAAIVNEGCVWNLHFPREPENPVWVRKPGAPDVLKEVEVREVKRFAIAIAKGQEPFPDQCGQ